MPHGRAARGDGGLHGAFTHFLNFGVHLLHYLVETAAVGDSVGDEPCLEIAHGIA
jgi:hypothetical protein